MKRIISTLLVCVLLLGCVFTLASCGKMLSGTYSNKVEAFGQSIETSYTFKGNKVTAEVKTTIAGKVNTVTNEGTYAIEDGEISFTFEEDGEAKTETFTFEEGEKNDVKYIKIGAIQYDKQ